MDMRVNRGARARLKPLAVCLALALGVATGLGIVAPNAEASDAAGPWQSFSRTKKTPSGRSISRADRVAMRGAASPASKPPARPSGGASVPVTNCNDEGAGSLRDAVENIAVSGDTVDMAGLNCSTITLISGAITTTEDDLTIVGPGTDMNGVTILAGHNSQIFAHLGSGTLTLEYLTVTSGGKYATGDSSALGGCVFSYGEVYLRDTGVKYCVAQTQGEGPARGGGVYATRGIAAVSSTISGNAVRGDRGFPTGGGLYTPGSLFMSYSWIHSNEATQATSQGVVFGSGGGVRIAGDVTMLNSTLSGNTAAAIAGAALTGVNASSNLEITNTTICDNYSYDTLNGSGLSVGSPIIISNSTITGNVAFNAIHITSGAGLYLDEDAAATLQSTIISGNSLYDGTTVVPDDIGHSLYGGALIGGANNLVGHSTLPLSLDTVVTSDPGLGPLTTANGGPTPTKTPLRDSLAINHGNNVGDWPYDERGPGFPRVIGSSADIGAVESDVIFSNGFD